MVRKILLIIVALIYIFLVSCSSNGKERSSKELFINAGEEPKTIDPTISGNDFVYL